MRKFLWQNLRLFEGDGVTGGGTVSVAPVSNDPVTPSTPSGDSPASPSGDTTQSFDGLGGYDDDDTIVLDSPAPAVDPLAVPLEGSPAPAPQATPTPVVPKAPVVPKGPAPAAPTEPAPAQAAPTPAPVSVEPQGLVQQLDQHRDAVIAGLAAKEFQLSKEEAEAFDADPVGSIPKLAATIYYRATQSALLHIQNFVPQMVVSMVKAMNDQQKAEDAFYGKYTGLDRTKHGADINQFAQAFRSANPTAPQGDFLAMAAAAVAAKFGIPLQSVAPAAQSGAAPAAPQPRVPAFVPAKSGVGVRVTPEPENAYAGLGQDFDD